MIHFFTIRRAFVAAKKSVLALTAGMLFLGAMYAPAWAGEKKVYTVFDEATGTVTYYYDDKMDSRAGVKEEYDGSSSTVHFADYRDNIVKAVVDVSMKDAPLTSAKYMFSVGWNKNGLSALTSIEGLKNINTSGLTDMSDMFGSCTALQSVDLSSFNTSNVKSMMDMFFMCESLTSLDLSGFNTANVTDMVEMFYGCEALSSLTFGSRFKTDNVKRMNSMFEGCTSLTSLDMSGFNTANVTNMRKMFRGCEKLTTLNLCSFTISNVTDMSQMFQGCHELTTIYCNDDWRKSDVLTSSENMFNGCWKLKGGRGTAYNSAYQDKQYARPDEAGQPGYFTNKKDGKLVYTVFDESTGTLTYYYDDKMYDDEARPGIKEEYTGSSTTVHFADYRDNIVKAVVDVSMKDAPLTSAQYMFSVGWNKNGFSALTSIIGLENLNAAVLTDMSNMFHRCSSLQSVDLSGLKTGNVTSMMDMFYLCTSLTSLDLSGFNTANVTDMGEMFYGCELLSSLTFGDGFTADKTTRMRSMFYGCKSLETIDLTTFNTANVTDMSYMFQGCFELTTIYCNDDLNKSDALTSSEDMFNGCWVLRGGEGTEYSSAYQDKTYARPDEGESKPGYFTKKRNDKLIYTVFDASTKTLTYYCDKHIEDDDARPGIKEVYDVSGDVPTRLKDYYQQIEKAVADVSMKDTALTSTDYMFCGTRYAGGKYKYYYLSNLKSIEGLENLNTENATSMRMMFYGCSSLSSIDVSSLKTSNVRDMWNMFADCSSLISLDLHTFDISKVQNMVAMFSGCSALTTIYCNDDWRESSKLTSSDNMFKGCTSLQGGRGTEFKAGYRDKQHARPDRGKSLPGYFTMKREGKIVYSLFDASTKTLTYYCDDKMFDDVARPGIKEEYDMNHGLYPRLKDYYQQIEKAVIDVSMKDTALTFLSNMFCGVNYDGEEREYCYLSNLKSIEGLENLNTVQATEMHQMFEGCSSLSLLDVTSFNTANVIDMWAMFSGCSSLTLLDLHTFDITNVKGMVAMFAGCSALTTIYCNDNWSKSTTLVSSDNMFKGCTSLKGSQGTVCDGKSNINKRYARPDEAGKPGYFRKKRDGKFIYTVYDENTATLTYYCDELIDDADARPGIKEEYEAKKDQVRWRNYHDQVQRVVIHNSMKDTVLTSTAYMFYGGTETSTSYSLSSMTRIDGMGNLKTSNVTDMSNMFYQCGKLRMVDLSALKTDNVKNMHGMFANCYELASIDLSLFNTGKVKDMSSMFSYCMALKTLEFANYDISSLTDATDMFYGCHSLTAIYCDEDWAASKKLTSYANMFTECFSLVGDKGSRCDGRKNVSKYYAMPDQGEHSPGYFSHASDEVTINGIRYKLFHSTKTAKVIALPSGKYEGDIDIPTSVTYMEKKYTVNAIGEKAFFECPDLLTVTVPRTVTKIEDLAICDNPQLYYIDIVDDNETFCDREGVLFSKDGKTLIAYPTAGMTYYTVPDGVEKISKYAFTNSPVTSLVLPASLTEINESAFSPNDLEKIICQAVTPPVLGKDVFDGIGSSVPVYVPNGSVEAYKAADGWKDLNIISANDAKGVLIGDLYYNLYSKDMSAEVTSSPDLYRDLDEIVVPQTVEYLGFEFVVTKIGYRAFMDCENFSTLAMPNSIKEIDDEAFYGALGLEYVYLSDQLTRIGNTAFGKAGIVELWLPTHLERIEEMAFAGCPFEYVGIPNSVTFIGENAFNGCYNLVYVEIGEAVQEIGDMAFAGSSLETVIVHSMTVPAIGTDVFWTYEGTLSDIQVPCGTLEDYQAAKGWKDYSGLMRIPPLPYELTVIPSAHGTVEVPEGDCGDGIYITTLPDEGYEFLQWTDGNTEQVREIELTQDTVFQAEFGKRMYSLEMESNNEEWGYVSSPQTEPEYPFGTVVTVVAQPNPGYKFVKWNNGKPLSTYNFVLKEHTYLRAIFLPEDQDPQQPVWSSSVSYTTIKWVPIEYGYNYILTVYLDEECTHVFYRYCFNQAGELFRVEFPAPYAPQRRAPQEEGFKFTINGLTADTEYFFRLETMDDMNRLIYTDEGSFHTENADVAAVKALIDAIGEVVYTEDCKIRIDDARDAYDILTDDQKALITDEQLAVLTDAEMTYDDLKKAAEKAAADKEAADAVLDKIAAIGEVEYTDASKALIDAAREAYDALSDAQKALITDEQLAVLTEAEKAYDDLKKAAEQAAADKEAADAVLDKIAAIGEVEYTDASKSLIDAAREAYDALSDTQKALITDEQLAVLTNAEKTYEELKKAAEEALFQDTKGELKALLDALLLPDDSEACRNIVEDAKAAVDAIALDSGKTITENIEAAEAAGKAIREQAQTDLEAQREAESHTTPTGLEERLQGDDDPCKKVIRNGVIYILHNGKTYLVNGQAVR